MNGHKNILLKTLLPVGIGIAVVAVMMARDFDIESWHSIEWTKTSILGVVLALLFTLGRETGLAWRFRVLSDKQLT